MGMALGASFTAAIAVAATPVAAITPPLSCLICARSFEAKACVIALRWIRWSFSLSEGSASGGGPPRNDGPSFFSHYYLYKMLTGIILISILGKCRESFTRSSGNLPSLVLPVHERACERSDAGEGESARRFDACHRRRDVRSALMPLRGSRNVRVGMAGGRTWASSSPSCDLEHEHVRQQLLRLYSEFAGEGPDSA